MTIEHVLLAAFGVFLLWLAWPLICRFVALAREDREIERMRLPMRDQAEAWDRARSEVVRRMARRKAERL